MSAHYFISDTHLGNNKSEGEEKLTGFLSHISGRADSLYILGDLFEFWFEFRQVIPKNGINIIDNLKRLRRSGTNIFLFRGNHDIWFNGWVERELQIETVYDQLATTIDDRRVFLAHGDALDKSFVPRLFRKLMRSRLNARLFSLVHPDIGISLAKNIAVRSRQEMLKRNKTQNLQKAMTDFAHKKLAEGFDLVILGHSHVPEIVHFEQGVYLNSGDWVQNFTYGLIQNGEPFLKWWR